MPSASRELGQGAGLDSTARATRSQTSSTRARSESLDACCAAARSSCARLSACWPRYNRVRTSTTGRESFGRPPFRATSSSSDAGPTPACTIRSYAAHEPTRSGVSAAAGRAAGRAGWVAGRAGGGGGAGASVSIGTTGAAPGRPRLLIRSIGGPSSAASASSSAALARASKSPTRRSSAANAAAWLTALPFATASRAAPANSAMRSARVPPPAFASARNVLPSVWARNSRWVALGARSSESAACRRCSPWLTSSSRPSVDGRAAGTPRDTRCGPESL